MAEHRPDLDERQPDGRDHPADYCRPDFVQVRRRGPRSVSRRRPSTSVDTGAVDQVRRRFVPLERARGVRRLRHRSRGRRARLPRHRAGVRQRRHRGRRDPAGPRHGDRHPVLHARRPGGQLVRHRGALPPQCVWVLSNGALAKVAGWTDTVGQYLWQPQVANGQPGTLFGNPVYEDPYAGAPGSAVANAVLFGDFERAIVLG